MNDAKWLSFIFAYFSTSIPCIISIKICFLIFFSLFLQVHILMEKRPTNSCNYQRIKGLIKALKRSPRVSPGSGVIHAPSQTSKNSNVANRTRDIRNRNRWPNGPDSAAEMRLWPRFRDNYLTVEPEISPNGLDSRTFSLKPINRPQDSAKKRGENRG